MRGHVLSIMVAATVLALGPLFPIGIFGHVCVSMIGVAVIGLTLTHMAGCYTLNVQSPKDDTQ